MNSLTINPQFNPLEIEQKWYQIWSDEKLFSAKKSTSKKSFSVLMPPPNVTGRLHMGHALNNTCIDILVRFHRMLGEQTLWIPGVDHAGIATQSVVEKKIYQEQKKTKKDLGRDKFLAEIWNWKNQYGEEIIQQLKSIGVSCDWDYFTFTMDPIPNLAVRKVFTKLFNKGLIYQAEKIIHWDTVLESAISDAEVETKEVKGKFYQIIYRIKNSDQELIVATTRPETLFGDTAIAVHPDDERYKDFIGKTAIIPICNREIPIIGDDYVEKDLGTGCLKVTPGHDFNDFELGKRHGLPIITILTTKGIFNSLASEIEGLDVTSGRARTVKTLEELNVLKSVEDKTQQIGYGERSGSVVEPRVSKQWFLNVSELAKRANLSIQNKETAFFPENWNSTYFSWMDNPLDWCISRQLWWGHRIPVYTCSSCKHQWANEQEPESCPECRNKNFTQDEDVLDTWFSSGLWPLSTLGWPDEKAMKEKKFHDFYPQSILVTGSDIIFFWVARMMMMCTEFSKNDQSPFAQVYLHAIIRDKFGRKMSKSLGNGIDPLDLIKQFGCDALRFSLASGSGYNRALNLDPAKIETHRNFMNKIWNAFRFIYPHLESEKKSSQKKLSFHECDIQEKWILSELNQCINTVTKSLNIFRFDEATSAIYAFTYDHFCSWFIELSKDILYGKDSKRKNQRVLILKYCFQEFLKLLHPFSPFISEELWSYFNKSRLISENFPIFDTKLNFENEQTEMSALLEIITQVRNIKASMGISPKEKMSLCLFTDDKKLAKFLFSQKGQFKKLINIKKGSIQSKNAEKPKLSAMSTTNHTDIYIPLEGIVDLNKERERISSQLEKIKIELSKNEAILANKNFMSRAPEIVVLETKEKILQLGVQIESLVGRLNTLKE